MHILATTVLTLLCTTMSAAAMPSLASDTPKWIHGSNPCDCDKPLTVIGSIASWCPYSGKYISPYEDLYEQAGDSIAIGLVSKESRDDLDMFVEEHLLGSDVPLAQVSREWYNQLTEDVEGVPHTFILNSANEIIWEGHPARLMDAFVRDERGRIDAKRSKAYLLAAHRSAEAVDQHDEAEAEDRPALLKRIMRYTKVMLRIRPADRDALNTLSRCFEISDDRSGLATFLSTIDPHTLTPSQANSIAWAMITNDTRTWQFPREVLRLSRYSLQHEPGCGAFLDTLARIHYLLGDLPRALEKQREAAIATPGDDSITTTLAYYESLMASDSNCDDSCAIP